jgi:anti-sigma-K factor RskA
MSSTPEEPNEIRGCEGVDVAPYALGALEPVEAEAFAEHLQTCVVCRDELAEFERVVAALPLSVPPHRAPRSLRRRVLGAVDGEARPTSGRSSPRRLRLVLPRPALAAGLAAVVVALAVFAGLELGSGPTSPATRVFAAQVRGLPGTAKLEVTGNRAELIVHHLAAPPAGHVYEVWLARGRQAPMPTTALFSVTTAGDGDVAVPGSLRGVNTVMVTPEPAGGSRVPTHAPVILAHLT